MQVILSLLAGALFGAGLMVSDMIDPARVRAFLDVASGAWDPTLAFVMGGAMLPMLIAWRVSARMRAPACGGRFPGPPSGRIDGRLLGGAALFGLGWGLVGFCPGPALAALTLGGWPVVLFVVAMLTGMAVHSVVAGRGAVAA